MKQTSLYLPDGFNEPVKLLSRLREEDESRWIKRGEIRALKLFHLMAKRVPAYKDFLKKHKLDPDKIKTFADFKHIPLIDKNNYLRKYSLEKLCWDGKIRGKSWTICSTSGSTGEPYYFPHEKSQDMQYSIMAELYLRTNFQIHKKSTLYIIGFMMGEWIGGVFTYEALRLLAERGGYDLSVITPGTNKRGIINAVKKLGPLFDQIIIGSYGPFLKDVLDDGIRMGVKWKDFNLGFVFSAEGFSEGMRDYVLNISGAKNIYTATLNHYGTVDLGTMSYETPLAIMARRFAVKNRGIYKDLFGDSIKLPTLTQFIPELFFFEEVGDTVICSAFSGIPLVRYNLNDIGGVCSFRELVNIFNDHKIDILKKSFEEKISKTVWKLPFVWVFERNDFSVKFYLCDIYPETIRKALFNSTIINKITGKFTMLVKFDKKQNQYLEINVELQPGVKEDSELNKKVYNIITQQLLKENLGYRNVFERIGKRAIPKIIFWPYESPNYFKPGVKQKWVKK